MLNLANPLKLFEDYKFEVGELIEIQLYKEYVHEIIQLLSIGHLKMVETGLYKVINIPWQNLPRKRTNL